MECGKLGRGSETSVTIFNFLNLKTTVHLPTKAFAWVFFLLFVSVIPSHAQNQEIKIYKTFGGVRFEMDTLTLSTKQVLNILSIDPVAYDEFKLAKRNDNISGILGFTGAFLIAFPIGTAIAGGEPEWWLAAGGGALILASIPFNRSFKNHAVNALDLYNKRFAHHVKPNLYFTGTGLKMIVRF